MTGEGEEGERMGMSGKYGRRKNERNEGEDRDYVNGNGSH